MAKSSFRKRKLKLRALWKRYKNSSGLKLTVCYRDARLLNKYYGVPVEDLNVMDL